MGLVKTRHKGVSMVPQPPPGGLTPVADWDVVPNQRITSLFNIGVVAFSKFGIANVAFTFSGTGGANVNANVSQMSLNAETGVWEYWATIDPALWDDGDIFCDAVVRGVDGGERILSQLRLVNNAGGSIDNTVAYVATNGNDSTGIVNDRLFPYASMQYALFGIASYRSGQGWGSSTDGATVYLEAGNHIWDNAGQWSTPGSVYEWCTIRPAPGETSATVSITQGTSALRGGILKLEDLTLIGFAGNQGIMLGNGGSAWAERCDTLGAGPTVSQQELFRSYDNPYITNSTVRDVPHGSRNFLFARACDYFNIGEDVLFTCPFSVNIKIDGTNIAEAPGHSDCVQWAFQNRSWDNLIIYGLHSINNNDQGIMVDDQGGNGLPATNVAIVNVYVSKLDTALATTTINMHRGTNHLIISGVTGLNLNGLNVASCTFFKKYSDNPLQITDGLVRGNVFSQMSSSFESEISADRLLLDENHYEFTPPTSERYLHNITTNVTLGDPIIDASGHPTAGSPLLARIAPFVPIDVLGKVRSNPTAIGAFDGVA